MNSDINQDILDKIKNSSQPENIKGFLYEILDLEYDHIDESNPQLKKEYVKLINQYKG